MSARESSNSKTPGNSVAVRGPRSVVRGPWSEQQSRSTKRESRTTNLLLSSHESIAGIDSSLHPPPDIRTPGRFARIWRSSAGSWMAARAAYGPSSAHARSADDVFQRHRTGGAGNGGDAGGR